MTDQTAETDQFNWARLAGFSYLGVAICAGFSEFFVRTGLTVPVDALATTNRILANETLFRLGGVSDLLVILLDVLLALAFYNLFKPVNKNLALLALFLCLLRLPWMGANVLNHFGILLLLNGDGYMSAFSAEQVQSLVMLLLDLHAYGYTALGILFGAWCFVVGYLIFKSGFMPRVLGVLMMIALVGYWTDLLVAFLVPQYDAMVSPIAVVPAALAEIAVTLWLVFMGGRVHRGWVRRVQQQEG